MTRAGGTSGAAAGLIGLLVLVGVGAHPADAAGPAPEGMTPDAGRANCAEEVRRLADTYGLDLSAPEARTEGDTPAVPPAPPATEESQGPTSGVARGGVIRPPEEGAPIAIEPPSTGPNSMPTAPPAEGGPGPDGGGERAAGLDAAKRSQVESLLLAADSAASRGDEAGCRARVDEARGVADARGR